MLLPERSAEDGVAAVVTQRFGLREAEISEPARSRRIPSRAGRPRLQQRGAEFRGAQLETAVVARLAGVPCCVREGGPRERKARARDESARLRDRVAAETAGENRGHRLPGFSEIPGGGVVVRELAAGARTQRRIAREGQRLRAQLGRVIRTPRCALDVGDGAQREPPPASTSRVRIASARLKYASASERLPTPRYT